MCVWAAYTSLLAISATVSPEPTDLSLMAMEAIPETPVFPVSPAVAKRLVFTFYAMVVLCAWAAHASRLPPFLFASQSPLQSPHESPALSCLLDEFLMLEYVFFF